MRSEVKARVSDRFCCWLFRVATLIVLAAVGLGLVLALRGTPGALSQALMLLLFGSLMPFLAQVLAEATGAYSRVTLINEAVRLYSFLWLPSVALFIFWMLWLGRFGEAWSALVVFGFFMLIRFGARHHKRKRDAVAAA